MPNTSKGLPDIRLIDYVRLTNFTIEYLLILNRHSLVTSFTQALKSNSCNHNRALG
jgi:hypothetical protein